MDGRRRCAASAPSGRSGECSGDSTTLFAPSHRRPVLYGVWARFRSFPAKLCVTAMSVLGTQFGAKVTSSASSTGTSRFLDRPWRTSARWQSPSFPSPVTARGSVPDSRAHRIVAAVSLCSVKLMEPSPRPSWTPRRSSGARSSISFTGSQARASSRTSGFWLEVMTVRVRWAQRRRCT